VASESMTSEERIIAALRLEKPDRTPIMPSMWYGAVATLGGFDPYELALADSNAMLDAELKVFDQYGGWDAEHILPLDSTVFMYGGGMTLAPPTPESPVWQLHEQENMTYDDYDIVADIGWDKFVVDVLSSRLPDWNDAGYHRCMDGTEAMYQRAVAEYEDRRGIPIFARSVCSHPFFVFSLARSMLKFTEDLYYRPEKLHKALQKATEDTIRTNLEQCKKDGRDRFWITEERAGRFFYPLSIFDEFWWPYTVQIVDAFWSEGILTQFHLDTPWDKNIHYWKQLPKGSCAFHLDSTTDIFAAKELLRGHVCLIGDVSASLFSLGTPEEVEAYVKRLIDEVGGDGGFILGSGCNVPNMVKPENFKAFLKTGKTYGVK
jgi:uroporphyrinogen-III decarboxylase